MNWRLLDIRHGTLGQMNFALLYIGLLFVFWVLWISSAIILSAFLEDFVGIFIPYFLFGLIAIYLKTVLEVRRLRDMGLSVYLCITGIVFNVSWILQEYALFNLNKDTLNTSFEELWIIGIWQALPFLFWFYGTYLLVLVLYRGDGHLQQA